MKDQGYQNRRRPRTQEQVEEQLRMSDELPFDEAVDNDPIIEVSLEEMYEEADDPNADLALEEIIDTKHTDGSTTNPEQAWEQGLVYEPPYDPPVIISDNAEQAEVAAGFAQSMEDSDPDREQLPKRVNNQDLDLEDDILEALRYNAETTYLDVDKLEIHVNNGIVYLYGTVISDDDIDRVEAMIRDLDGIQDVENFLEIEDLNDESKQT